MVTIDHYGYYEIEVAYEYFAGTEKLFQHNKETIKVRANGHPDENAPNRLHDGVHVLRRYNYRESNGSASELFSSVLR